MAQTSNEQKTDTPMMSEEEKNKHGCFDGLKQEMNKIGNTIQKELDVAGHKISSEIHQHAHATVFNNFVTGNKIQLVSKINGRALQVTHPATGGPIVYGNGDLGPDATDAIWTVINEGNNRVHLHNNFDYLVILAGVTGVMHFDEGDQVADETRFQLIAKGEKFVVLESVKEYAKCVGVREDGTLMPASHCSAVDEHAKFCVYLVDAPLVEKVLQGK